MQLLSLFRRRCSASSSHPSSASALPAPPPLPTELVLYIFELASASNPSVLPLLARLSSYTRKWAEQQLYERVVLSITESVKRFTRTLERNSLLAGRVNTLVVDAGGQGLLSGLGFRSLPASLEAVVKLLPALKEVKLRHLAIYSLIDFAACSRITSLTLYSCLLSDITSEHRSNCHSISLPSLRTLTLKHVQLEARIAETFLSPRCLPALKTLHSEGVRLFVKLGRGQAGRVGAGPLDLGTIRPKMRRVEGGVGEKGGWKEEEVNEAE